MVQVRRVALLISVFSLGLIICNNKKLGGIIMKNKEVNVEVVVSGIDEVTAKAEKLVELIKEAKTLAGELASVSFDIELKP